MATPNVTTLEERFWSKVEKSADADGCWLWTDFPTPRGYGRFRVGTRKVPAHRFSWELVNGPVPDGMRVCHDCPGGDNPACVNPAHLWLGTDGDNIADRDRKGRTATGHRHGTHTKPESIRRGERNGYARLTESQAAEIRQRIQPGPGVIARIAAISEEFGVSPGAVAHVVYRRSWKG